MESHDFFRKQLLAWFETHHRPMPWKGEKDPYLIWLSEIILQQTRVEQGWDYYLRFRARYPTVNDLASAPLDEVLKQWEGLGYYSRARNMHQAARYIAEKLNGVFPSTYEEILKLKGVGPYTAAAISSFAFGLPHAVVDGNVNRVIARYFDVTAVVNKPKGKKEIQKYADQLLDLKDPGRFNQAIMEFGSLVCSPRNPDCPGCLMQAHCRAYKKDVVLQRPAKASKAPKKNRYFNYLVVRGNAHLLLQQRTQKDIWQGLYQFPLIESDALLEQSQIRGSTFFQEILLPQNAQIRSSMETFRQTLSHQHIHARFWWISLEKKPLPLSWPDTITISEKAIDQYAFPRIIDRFRNQKAQQLNIF